MNEGGFMTTVTATKYDSQTWHVHPELKGVRFRKYETGERYYQFRQYPFGTDYLGILDDTEVFQIVGQLRGNRKSGIGPQTWKAIQAEQVEQAAAVAIVEVKERKKIIREEDFAQKNTIGRYWTEVYYPDLLARAKNKRSAESVNGTFDRWVRPVVGDIPFQELRSEDIKNMLERVAAAGLKPRTIFEAYKLVRQCWTDAQAHFSDINKVILPAYPGKVVRKRIPKDDGEKTCYLRQDPDPAKDEAMQLLSTLYHWRQISRERGSYQKGKDTKEAFGFAVLALFCGLRRKDIYELNWRDVDHVEMAYAKNPKNAKRFGIHIDVPIVRNMFDERRTFFPSAKPDDPVFVDTKGQRWAAVPAYYFDAVKHLGLNEKPFRLNNKHEKIDFHALRHTYASWLAMQGVDLHIIMTLMNHSDIKMTLRYARLNPNYTRKPAHELAEGFAKKHNILVDGEIAYVKNEGAPDIEVDTTKTFFRFEMPKMPIENQTVIDI